MTPGYSQEHKLLRKKKEINQNPTFSLPISPSLQSYQNFFHTCMLDIESQSKTGMARELEKSIHSVQSMPCSKIPETRIKNSHFKAIIQKISGKPKHPFYWVLIYTGCV